MDDLENYNPSGKITINLADIAIFENSSDYDYTNSTDVCCSLPPCSFYETLEFDKVFLPIFYTIIFLLGLPGNTLVIGVLLRYKQTRTSTDTFILHLAFADILLVLTLPFWAVQAVLGWIFGTAMCKIIGSIFTINFYSSIFLLVCISFDRYLAIVHAIQMYRKHKTHMVHLSCSVVWGFCILLTIPDMVFLQEVYEHRQNTTECLANFHFSTAKHWKTAIRFIYHVVGFLLPLLVMLFCYIRITLTLLGSQGSQKHKSMRVIIAVVVAFFLCWAPYNLTMLMDTLLSLNILARDCQLETRVDISTSVTSTLGYFHCCLNPLLYAFIGIKFRNNLLEILRKIGCISSEFLKKNLKPQRGNSNWSESADTSYSGI